MEETDHHLLVGLDAQRFARVMGFKIERDLNTERSRRLWMEWKRKAQHSPFLRSSARAESWRRAMVAEGLIDPEHYHGTVHCMGVNAKGEVAGVTSTSGLAWKVPGRVGDSPILGAGLYVDGDVGGAGSTGHGEASMMSLGSFLIVELMRNGMSPRDAGLVAMKRVVANTVDKRLLNSRGKPNFNLRYYALNTKGEYAGLSLYESSENGKRPADFLLPGMAGD
jgi:N4-(beta-N-acetylglucosaminyl)-L-asparaginase